LIAARRWKPSGRQCRVALPIERIVAVNEVSLSDVENRVRESFARQGFMRLLGAELSLIERGRTEIKFPFSATLTQQHGFVHAAAITAVLDSACGYAALSVAPEGVDVLSTEFKVNLMSPAAGEKFIARAHVKRAGRTLSVCSADAFAVSGGVEKLIATMLATIIRLPIVEGGDNGRATEN